MKKELSGKFEEVILALMTPAGEFQAQELKHALKKKDGEAIVQILFACEPSTVR